MAPRLVADPAAAACAVGLHACPLESLAALGPVLCLHAASDPHPLSGWTRSRRLLARVWLDSDGPCESLHFLDAHGVCCWRLLRLPDSDFLAWEALLARLPVEGDAAPARAQRIAWKRSVQPRWQACALRLHVLPRDHPTRLAASDVALSPLGSSCARRLARELELAGPPRPAPPPVPSELSPCHE